ncbi:MAG TPA: HD domain-containing protein [Candidatus Onthousia faecavium]|nr:HD domain-containing protein [Candidatus Onthousia faecavium]
MNNFAKAKENFLKKEENLSIYATKSKDAIRLKEETEDIRPPFFHDIDRIIHSLSYTRYLNKTQVYIANSNDHVSKRITHVQLVSKIARTIGRALNLNEDLIEAIALGHDIGHTPLGHVGESILNKISREELGEYFAHNIEGVRYYMYIAKNGLGLNLTVQVLDGIMTHNGEMLSPVYEPTKKTKKEFLREYQESYQDIKKANTYHAMTLEGCVVRISDVIGYIGRDIEDAIMLGNLKREDIPKEITNVLGDNNKDIINTLILDIINESLDKPYIKLSDKVYNALVALKKFNYDNIYNKALSKSKYEYYEKGIYLLYKKYLQDLEHKNYESTIYQTFLNHQSDIYLQETSSKRQVIDFIAGMTDDFLMRELEMM